MNDAFRAALWTQLAVDCLTAASSLARDFPGLHPRVAELATTGRPKRARITIDSWVGRASIEFPPGMPLAEIEQSLRGFAVEIGGTSAGVRRIARP